MKRMPILLSVGRSTKTQKLQNLQTVPGMLQMQNDAKNKRTQRMLKLQELEKMPKIATNVNVAKRQGMEWMHKQRNSKMPKSKDCQNSKEGTKKE